MVPDVVSSAQQGLRMARARRGGARVKRAAGEEMLGVEGCGLLERDQVEVAC